MDAYVDGCRATSISTGHPDREIQEIVLKTNLTPGKCRHSKPCLPSLERRSKSASLSLVALRSGIQPTSLNHVLLGKVRVPADPPQGTGAWLVNQ